MQFILIQDCLPGAELFLIGTHALSKEKKLLHDVFEKYHLFSTKLH